MKHALLDPRQILPVVDGLECIAEQKIDRQIFVLDGKRVPEGGGRRVLTDCRVQHDPEAARQMLHVVEDHPTREEPSVSAAKPRQPDKTTILILLSKEPPRQHRDKLVPPLVQQTLHPSCQQQNERQAVCNRPCAILRQPDRSRPSGKQRRI